MCTLSCGHLKPYTYAAQIKNISFFFGFVQARVIAITKTDFTELTFMATKYDHVSWGLPLARGHQTIPILDINEQIFIRIFVGYTETHNGYLNCVCCVLCAALTVLNAPLKCENMTEVQSICAKINRSPTHRLHFQFTSYKRYECAQNCKVVHI